MLTSLLENGGEAGRVGANRPERAVAEQQRIFPQMNAMVVMVSLLVVFVLQYFLINSYITLLLVSILLAGALEVSGNVLRSVESDSWGRRFKVKFCFIFCGSLSLYFIIHFGTTTWPSSRKPQVPDRPRNLLAGLISVIAVADAYKILHFRHSVA